MGLDDLHITSRSLPVKWVRFRPFFSRLGRVLAFGQLQLGQV
jgi:hypothetical protein